MSETSEKNPLRFFTLAELSGGGQAQAETTDEQGPLYGLYQGRVLFWNRSVDEVSIWSSTLRKWSQVGFVLLLLLFGVFGLLLGLIGLSQVWEDRISWEALWSSRTDLFGVFWVSVLVDLLAVSFLARQEQNKRALPRYQEAPLAATQLDVQHLARIPSKDWIDVAQYFSGDAIKAVEESANLASSMKHDHIEPIHLLAVIARQKECGLVFARLGVNPRDFREQVDRALKRKTRHPSTGPVLSSSMYRLLLDSYAEAYRRRAREVTTADLLTAVMVTGKEAQNILYDLNIELEELRNVVVWVTLQQELRQRLSRFHSLSRFKPKGTMNRAMTAIATPYLDRFSQDLTLLARAGALEYCVNRHDEHESIFRAMESEAYGVVLVGQPGVGRKTIVNGLAQRMVTEDVPPMFHDKRLVSVSLGAVAAGASAPGVLEERLFRLLSEVARSGNIILFIEDIHNMVGMNTEQAEGLDFSEVFAQQLSQHQILVISTSNPLEYRRYVETSALGDALHRIEVAEMDEQQTIHVLESKAGFIEAQQRVFFSYEAIAAAYRLAKRYVYDRFFPDKAIRLLEEVAAFVRRTRGKDTIVEANDVAQVIASKVRVPVTDVTEKESAKLMHLEERIHERLVDQEPAVKMVAEALRRARAELRDEKRPIVNLLFLGPTGVGKTELSKTVAEVYFGSENAMIRIDMSEYQTKDSVDRLIGSPNEQAFGARGGYLTEAVRRNPYSLILLDEIEKAHPDILNIFLQVLDDGRLTDSLGRTIDFTSAIIIATSNAGTPLIQRRVLEGREIEAIRDELINEELKNHFRPEFLNRFDGVMVFRPLSHEDLTKIANILLRKVAARLLEKGIQFRATEEAIEELVNEGYDPAFGARPLRRVIQNTVDTALANYLLSGKLSRRDVAVLETGGKIRVEKAERL
ncbi:MAG: ATP-dependent Clp protease ATP-binding subunit [bacterium]|nr:ATP-dependent Clp protease ATP-binding subunit [bacterium]